MARIVNLVFLICFVSLQAPAAACPMAEASGDEPLVTHEHGGHSHHPDAGAGSTGTPDAQHGADTCVLATVCAGTALPEVARDATHPTPSGDALVWGAISSYDPPSLAFDPPPPRALA